MTKKIPLGPQTAKAVANFPFRGARVSREFLVALIEIKKAAARANAAAGVFSAEIGRAIENACDEALALTPSSKEGDGGSFFSLFLLPGIQGGAGTSINMNVNEALAARAKAHPNDHVNASQSTNDANPSAARVAARRLTWEAVVAFEALATALEEKAKRWKRVPKLARTHLQDAIPTTLGAEFASYAAIIRRGMERLQAAAEPLRELNLGGTAIGNGLNASAAYRKAAYRALNEITGENYRPGKNLMALTSSQTDFVALSQALTAVMLDASKIASDLRLLASGPRGGFGEIAFEEAQAGSSIMPGKVNPIFAESVNQAYFAISGNDLAVQHAAHAAQLELGVMLPVIIDRLFDSLKLSADVIRTFAERGIRPLHADEGRCLFHLEHSFARATLLVPALGYDQVSACVKKACAEGKTLREVIVDAGLLSDKAFDEMVKE